MKRAISRCSVFLLCVTAMLVLRCDIPGCGPGEVPRNPLSSNLVDFTLPASQSILRLPDPDGFPDIWEFRKLEFYFLRSMRHLRFSVEDDLSMCRIPEGDATCDPGDPNQAVDASIVFTTSDWDRYNDVPFTKLTLSADSSSLEPAGYLVRLEKDGSSPLISWEEAQPLDEDVDVFLTIVGDEPIYWVEVESSNIEEGVYHGYFTPHHHIRVTFNTQMGFINFVPYPEGGFNFDYVYDDEGYPVGIQSDSMPGLNPGRTDYQLDILTDDVLPNGMPWTMDRYGNLLREESYSSGFDTSHVRILFPVHQPCSEEPDDWYSQLQLYGYGDEMFFFAEVTKEVEVLTDSGFGIRSSIPFEDKIITQEEKDSAVGGTLVVKVEVDPDEIPECNMLPNGDYTMADGHLQNLQVFAWRDYINGVPIDFRGTDKLAVDALPEDYDFGFPQDYYYINDEPSDNEGGYKNELNGVAHDSNHWYFSNNEEAELAHPCKINPRLWKIPKYRRLNDDYGSEYPDHGVYTISLKESQTTGDDMSLADMGYNHFGDIDYIEIDSSSGFVIAPVEQVPHRTLVPLVAFYETSVEEGDFEYRFHDELSAQNYKLAAPWCAYNPVDGKIYSSYSEINFNYPIKKYSIEFTGDGVDLTPAGSLYIQDGTGPWNVLPRSSEYPDMPELKSIQGGAFSSNGHLYIVNGNEQPPGIWVFDLNDNQTTATLARRSCRSSGSGYCQNFVFNYSDAHSGEPEGIDIWDLDSDPFFELQGLHGQIHVIVIDNWPYSECKDDWFFKHYQISLEEKCKI